VSRFDRYALSQYLLLFGFFALVLVAVYWVNRAVVLFDKLIGDGQSALVFLEFTALMLPNLIRVVIPVAVFISAVWVTNRLNSESELTVLRATGTSPWQMAKPVLAFGLVAALMMSALTHYLVPASIDRLKLRESEISRNVTAKLLTEGSFLHPTTGVSFFIRQIDEDGTLNDVFLSDMRDPELNTIYTASEAFLIREEGTTYLVMVDGLAQRMDVGGRQLSATTFSDFSYDISALADQGGKAPPNVETASTQDLLRLGAGIDPEGRIRAGDAAEELHLRFARALICLAVALIGFSALQLGSFSRLGVWRPILFAFVLLILIEGMRGPLSEIVKQDASQWPLMYVPTLAGLLTGALFLKLAATPSLLRLPFGARRAAQ
jgi:lipopolysaccharide export system permease protein